MFNKSIVKKCKGNIKLIFNLHINNFYLFSKVVLIDEGTANLDNDSELAIQVVLKNAFRTSTVLIIAHRLNGLQNTDKIIVVDNGEIVETGTPKELSTDPTTYLFRMLQEQNNSQFH